MGHLYQTPPPKVHGDLQNRRLKNLRARVGGWLQGNCLLDTAFALLARHGNLLNSVFTMPRDICPVKSPSREYTVMFSDKPHWGGGFISILPEQGMQTFDQRFFFSLFLLSSPGIPQQQFLPRLLAQTPHHLSHRGDNAPKYTGAACYWLLNGQQEPSLNWFPLFLKINMRLMGNSSERVLHILSFIMSSGLESGTADEERCI